MSHPTVPDARLPSLDPELPGMSKPIDPVQPIDSGWIPTGNNRRTGYVQNYQLELHEPLRTMHYALLEEPFFRVTLVDGLDTEADPEEFLLLRRHTANTVDRSISGDALTVSYGNVEQAMVATVKEALVHGKKLTVGWEDEVGGNGPTGRKIILLVRLAR